MSGVGADAVRTVASPACLLHRDLRPAGGLRDPRGPLPRQPRPQPDHRHGDHQSLHRHPLGARPALGHGGTPAGSGRRPGQPRYPRLLHPALRIRRRPDDRLRLGRNHPPGQSTLQPGLRRCRGTHLPAGLLPAPDRREPSPRRRHRRGPGGCGRAPEPGPRAPRPGGPQPHHDQGAGRHRPGPGRRGTAAQHPDHGA